MKIAVFHELAPGGALRAVSELSRQLSRHHHVVVFEGAKEEKPTKGIWGRINHDYLALVRLSQQHRQIARRIDAGGFDAVFVHPSRWTQTPFLLSFLTTPSLYYCQEPLRLAYDSHIEDISTLPLVNRMYEKVNRYWRKWIDKKNISNAKMLVTNSQFTKKWIMRAYGLTASVCYLGVDTTLFSPQRISKIYDILFLGAPVSIEGYDLLEKAKKYSKRTWKIRIVQRKDNGKGIEDQELVCIINQSRMVVCLSKNEPFGLTVLEAGACGVPVIAVREGGYIESVIDKKTGLLIARDPHQLAQTIDDILDHPSRGVSMGREARRHIRDMWSWEESAKKIGMYLLRTKNEDHRVHYSNSR